MSDHRSEESRARDRKRQAKIREEFRAQGLTARGKPRKEQAKPGAHQAFVIHGLKEPPSYERREPTIPKRGETVEQRRARGFSIRGTPLARDIEERVRKRIEEM